MLVTALRDGMNLVAKEYVAARCDEDGVLMLSEFTGASDELRPALLVNPHDIDGVKDAILRAVDDAAARSAASGCGRCASGCARTTSRTGRRRFLLALREARAGATGEDPLGELEWTVERAPRK